MRLKKLKYLFWLLVLQSSTAQAGLPVVEPFLIWTRSGRASDPQNCRRGAALGGGDHCLWALDLTSVPLQFETRFYCPCSHQTLNMLLAVSETGYCE